MATVLDSALLELVARRSPQPNVWEPTVNLKAALSAVDVASYRVLESAFYPSGPVRRLQQHRISRTSTFASPLYCVACKEYFAASHLSNKLVLSVGEEFLASEIILSFLQGPECKSFNVDYFSALIGSRHLTEQITIAALHKTDDFDSFDSYKNFEDLKVLEFIPDAIITPEVINNWLDKASSWQEYLLPTGWEATIVAAKRIRQAHPEYDEFPDEWVLKVFCGN